MGGIGSEPVERPIVEILTTGGTIATIGPDGPLSSRPVLDAAELSAAVDHDRIQLRTRELARVPSWTLDPSTMLEIAAAARDAASKAGVAGVVVTHGTTTLEYTAFLAYLIQQGTTPIVLTGAMRRADDPDADGPTNLRAAVHVAASDEARGLGPLVVFGERILASRTIWKAHRTALDAFEDLAGDVGRIRGESVTIERRPAPGPALSGRLDSAVAFIKVVPGMDGRLVEAATIDARGLVIEALPGAGGIPPAMLAAVSAAARMIPVVVAPRAPFGRAAKEPTGGTGEPLAGLDLLSPGRLTAEAAWVLLMSTLGETGDAVAAKSLFRAIADTD
jgi:L-asparaginase